MPNPGGFLPRCDPSKKESPKPWYVGIPGRLTKTGKYQREYFASHAEARRRADQLRGLDQEGYQAALRAGPDLIRAAVNFDELFRDIYGFKGGLEEACEAFTKHLDEVQGSITLGQLLDDYESHGGDRLAKGSRDKWNALRGLLREHEARPARFLDTSFWRDWSEGPIPGGLSFENFELRMPFKNGRRLWFAILPDSSLPGL